MIENFRGTVITADDPDYDQVRRVYNGSIDKHPEMIAQCLGDADVVAAVKYAGDAGLAIAIRGGGHSVAGHGTCDGGLLVDLSQMRAVHVDPVARTAWVQGGATLADVDHETQLYALALPTGQVSMTGIGGLTLNGGMGMLQRKYGLTCDNLLEARLVTATGEIVTASAEENPELFWALRGGGGNFGVVTWFKFQLHEVGPIMVAGLVAYPIEQAPEVLAFLRDYIAEAPEEMSADIIFQFAPPLDAIPEEYRGSHVVGIFVRWCGGIEEGMAAVRPIQEFGTPVLDFVGPMPLVTVQSLLDPLNPDGNLHYWTGRFLPEMGEHQVKAVADVGSTLPTHFSIVEVIPFNAAPTRVPADDTAFSHRDEGWLIHVLGQWTDPAETETNTQWVRYAQSQLDAVGSGDSYLNLLTEDEPADPVEAFWSESRLARLRKVKQQFDPSNVFRFNHNVEP